MGTDTHTAAPQPPVNHLVWEGNALPCFVKVSVYGAGMAAGLGIKCTNPPLMKKFLADSTRLQDFRGMLRRQIDVELARQKVVYGLDEEVIVHAVSAFVNGVSEGTESMVMRRIAEGQLPEPGEDGRLEYVLNPDGLALRDMGRDQRRQARRQVLRVEEGDLLVECHPAAEGQAGQNVRGESIAPNKEGRKVVLERCAGPHTTVKGTRLLAALKGVVREDVRGLVRVVQELAVDEVNHATGDLPRSGVGDVNVLVRAAIARGAGVQSSDDVFVGTAAAPGIVEANSRVRARNLIVRGSVVGEQLPEPFMAGEVETLDEKAQQAVNSQVEAGRIQVEGIFAAQEVRERYVTAERVLLQANAFNSVLEAEGEVRVDGDVVGGAVSCAGLLQVRGNLGNEAGAPTRLRVATEPPGAEKRTALTAEFRRAKGRQVECETALGEHDDDMAARGKTSAYWAGLLKGEKLAPRNPLEKRLLSQFLEAVKAKKRLEQEAEDARLQARDLGNLLVEDAAEAAEATSEDLQIRVGGTVYPGVRCELLQPLAADDLQQAVRLATGEESNLQAVRARLLEALNHHLELYQEAVEERQAALDEIFKDQEEKRPEAPQIPNKRFEEKVLFSRGGRGPGALRCGLRPGPCPAGLLLAQDRRDQSPAAQRGIVDRTRRRADLAEPGGRCRVCLLAARHRGAGSPRRALCVWSLGPRPPASLKVRRPLSV